MDLSIIHIFLAFFLLVLVYFVLSFFKKESLLKKDLWKKNDTGMPPDCNGRVNVIYRNGKIQWNVNKDKVDWNLDNHNPIDKWISKDFIQKNKKLFNKKLKID